MKKLTKKIFSALAAAVMTVTMASPMVCADTTDKTVADGWVREGKIHRRYEDGLP